MPHINHITHWRAGGFTVETITDEAASGFERQTYDMRGAQRLAMARHDEARRDQDVARSLVLLVDARSASVIAAYPTLAYL